MDYADFEAAVCRVLLAKGTDELQETLNFLTAVRREDTEHLAQHCVQLFGKVGIDTSFHAAQAFLRDFLQMGNRQQQDFVRCIIGLIRNTPPVQVKCTRTFGQDMISLEAPAALAVLEKVLQWKKLYPVGPNHIIDGKPAMLVSYKDRGRSAHMAIFFRSSPASLASGRLELLCVIVNPS